MFFNQALLREKLNFIHNQTGLNWILAQFRLDRSAGRLVVRRDRLSHWDIYRVLLVQDSFSSNVEERDIEPSELAKKIREGDRAAETKLIAHYSKSIRFFLRRRYRDVGLIDDVWQEAFCRVIVKLRSGSLDDPDALPGFIRSVALNVAREHVRQHGRFKSSVSQESMVDLPAAGGDDPLETISHEKLIELVLQTIEEMSVKRDRQILTRFYIDHEEKLTVCRELGLESQHFDRVLYRARERLKQKIQMKAGLFTTIVLITMTGSWS